MSGLEQVVDQVIEKLGHKIVMGIPLAAGKPNYFVNALYRRAKENPQIELTICTALTLERPKPHSDLEKRFIDLFEARIFGDYPDLDYELDRTQGKLPDNIEVLEFYFPPAKYLNNKRAQRHYVSSNFTHVCRDMLDQGINLIAQMVAQDGDQLSLSCNADVTGDLIHFMREKEYPSMVVMQVNQNLPFMYGDAVISTKLPDVLIDQPQDYYKLFGPPKMSVSDTDFMIGLFASSLVKDDGELQVGIGSLGDAVVYGLVLRHKQNQIYNEVLEKTGFKNNFRPLINRVGGTQTFTTGLFGATEMMVDGFMELYKNNILKKKVYDHVGLQRLINENKVYPERLDASIVDYLLERQIIKQKIDMDDFEFLSYWGIIKEGCRFEDGILYMDSGEHIDTDLKDLSHKQNFINKCLGTHLKNGHLVHAGFFLGPNGFYEWLRKLPVIERKLFQMRSVLKINQLYGHETIDRLHRKNARFINTCMMTTLSGAHVSDGLEDGRLVSGVGGQYNFVAMAQELPDGHSILTMRATRIVRGKTKSNIVFNYGHITVPRHMRDILVTEYGVAFLRGKTDEKIIKELLNICDSRFQEELKDKAIQAGKLEQSYQIPDQFQNNLPETYIKILKTYKAQGHFSKFPFGTDLNEVEITLGGALKRLKAQVSSGLGVKLVLIFNALTKKVSDDNLKLLAHLHLDRPKSLKERILKKLVNSQL